MRFVIASALLVFILVAADAGPRFRESKAMATLHKDYDEYHFKVFSKSMLNAGASFGNMSQFDELIRSLKQVEVFEMNLEGPVDCVELKSKLESGLDKKTYDELISMSSPDLSLTVYAQSDSTSIQQLIAFSTDTVQFRVVEIQGIIDLKSLAGLGPSGLTNLLENPVFK